MIIPHRLARIAVIPYGMISSLRLASASSKRVYLAPSTARSRRGNPYGLPACYASHAPGLTPMTVRTGSLASRSAIRPTSSLRLADADGLHLSATGRAARLARVVTTPSGRRLATPRTRRGASTDDHDYPGPYGPTRAAMPFAYAARGKGDREGESYRE